jgi:hypothetical protein
MTHLIKPRPLNVDSLTINAELSFCLKPILEFTCSEMRIYSYSGMKLFFCRNYSIFFFLLVSLTFLSHCAYGLFCVADCEMEDVSRTGDMDETS